MKRSKASSRVAYVRTRLAQKKKRRILELRRRQEVLQVAQKHKNLTEAGRFMGFPPRLLARWGKAFCEDTFCGRGRPVKNLSYEEKILMYEHMKLHGWNVSLMRKTFPWATRSSLEFMAARWKRVKVYFKSKSYLFWNGSVWAMDFLERKVDNDCTYVLNVRDLASGKTLAARATKRKSMREVIRILQELFETYGKPLLIKSDNGGEFAGVCICDFLRKQEVVQLFSPAYFPSYNGACEVGGGWLMRRAFEATDFLSESGKLTSDALEYARCKGNSSPRRKRLSPNEEFSKRETTSSAERINFRQLVKTETAKVTSEYSIIEKSLVANCKDQESTKQKAKKEIDRAKKCARIGIERALAKAGILMVRRSRFPQLINSY